MYVLVMSNDDLVAELRDNDVDAESIDKWGEDELIDSGLERADALIVRGGMNAVEIPIALQRKKNIKTMLIADDAPDYVRGSVDLILSPELADIEAVLSFLRVKE